MTQHEHVQDSSYIIPYQELLGNYDIPATYYGWPELYHTKSY